VNSSSGNTISGNYVGTNALGTAGASNRGAGVRIFGGAGNIVGGTTPADGNLISGNGVENGVFNGNPFSTVNGSPGIFLDGNFNKGTNSCNSPATPVTGTIIQGNLIGTDHTGTSAIGNSTGVYMACSASQNIVGGTTAAERNVISGNRVNSFGLFGQGVLIALGASDNKVQGNYIGTNAAGTAAIPNEAFGVSIGYSALSSGAPNNVVGGLSPETGNVISGNREDGVLIFRNSNANSVQNNLIGTDAGGTANLGNGWSGVEIGGGASGNKIGGPGAGNLIANNQEAGVLVTSGSGNLITQNSIDSNVLLGIDLYAGAFGVTPNDPCDADTGANNLQNFPVLTSVSSSGGSTAIQGTLNSTPNTTFTLEFFANAAADPSGFGEGQTFIGSTTVTTDGNCNASFAFTTLIPFSGQFITATATGPGGNTSEFSAYGFVNADISISKTASPNPVVTGSDLTYALAVNYSGPAPAANVTVTDNVPTQTAFKSISAPAGWTCTTPAVGSNGPVTCTKPTMAPSESPATFTIVATVSCSVADGALISDTATISSATTDADPTNNSSTATVTASNPLPTISCPANIDVNVDANSCGAVVNYTTPVGTDNCAGASTTQTAGLASGATFPVGTTTNTYKVTDASGNTAECSFTVTVHDSIKPQINCPANMTVPQDSAFGAVVNYTTPVGTDNCPGVTTSCTLASGSTFSLGTTTVTCTAQDTSGNKSSCSFTVTVVPPPSTVGVKSTDGGSIPIPGGTSTFGIVAMASSTGFVKGDVEYQDHVTGMNLKSTMITAIVVNGTHARIFGKATINGSGSCDFVVDVDDLGEPGIGSDKFGIQVSNGYTAGPSKLSGGNIQIHN
jgi:titin